MSRTRIKICGITNPDDARAAADAGADAIGLNFFRGPRKIDFPTATRILAALPPMVTPVGLVEHIDREDPRATSAVEAHAELGIRAFQTYTAGEQFVLAARWNDRLDWWAVVHVASRASIANIRGMLRTFKSPPQAILLDTAAKGLPGGTGQTFNWHWIAEARNAGELDNTPPIILAGGLNPDNVAEAVRIAQPWAVDVSSGVEFDNQPGKKDPARIRAFIQAVQTAWPPSLEP